MKFANAIGWVMTRIILTIMYLIIIGIPAIFLWIFRKDLLNRRFSNIASYWIDKEPVPHTVEHAKHLF
jgi:hypothetical protein